MEAAVKEHPKLINDEEAKETLVKYFRYTAHYIVAASDFMRPDQVRLWSILRFKTLNSYKAEANEIPSVGNQLSGGTQTDYGRSW